MGEVDALDFILARDLGLTLSEVRQMPNQEIEEWRAWYAVKRQREQLEELRSRAR